MPVDKSTLTAFANVAASQTDAAFTPPLAGIPGRKYRVISFLIVNGDTAASTVVFNSKPAGAGTAISATFKTAANGVLPSGDVGGWFNTNVGEGLTVTTGAGAATPVAIQVVCGLVS